MAGEHRFIAAEAEETVAQIKALNRRLAASRSAAERDSLKALIAAAKVEWWRRTSPAFARVRAEQDGRSRGG